MMKKMLLRFVSAMLLLMLILPSLPGVSLAIPLDGTAFSFSSEDPNGETYPPVTGKATEAVRIIVPLVCRDITVTNVSVTPIFGDIEVFPFNVTKQDYTKKLTDIYPEAVNLEMDRLYEVSFHFSISKDATKGAKNVSFLIKYLSGGNEMSQTYTIPVVITEKKSSSSGSSSSSSSSFRSAPKVILDEISFSQRVIYAGDSFELALDFVNTSEKEAIRNMQVTVSDETGTVLPANDSSNTQYIERIEKNGGLRSLIFPMQVSPGAEAKSFMLKVSYAYDGVSTRAEFKNESSIAVPVQQKMRVRFDSPVVYDDAWLDQSVSASVQMFNMGKSVIYNTMVSVEGSGLSLEEMYFGGNITAGGTMRAEFNIVTSVAGQIEGAILVSYEDVYGNVTTERLPLSIFVNETAPIEEPVLDGAMEGESVPLPGEADGVRILGLPWYVWAIVLTVLIGLIILFIIRAKRRRARELMEI